MQYRSFGNTGLMVSEIGFGAWAIGGGAVVGGIPIGWGDANDEDSVKAIHAALDAGINFFDTADIYGLGRSEQLIGDVLGNIQGIIIATKAGNVAREQSFSTDYSYDHIIQACSNSLRRLKREHIDYYQLHTARIKDLEHGECIRAMEDLQRKGLIRYWGISLNTFEPLPEAEWIIERDYGSGFQAVLNLINQRACPLFQMMQTNRYGFIARMPLQFGLLTGKFNSQTRFGPNDHRSKRLPGTLVEACNDALQPIWKLCDNYQCTRTSLALNYVLSQHMVSTVIPGIRTVSQVRENTHQRFQLSQTDLLLIESTMKPSLDLLMRDLAMLG